MNSSHGLALVRFSRRPGILPVAVRTHGRNFDRACSRCQKLTCYRLAWDSMKWDCADACLATGPSPLSGHEPLSIKQMVGTIPVPVFHPLLPSLPRLPSIVPPRRPPCILGGPLRWRLGMVRASSGLRHSCSVSKGGALRSTRPLTARASTTSSRGISTTGLLR